MDPRKWARAPGSGHALAPRATSEALQLDLELEETGRLPPAGADLTARVAGDNEARAILTRLHYDGQQLIAGSDKRGHRTVAWMDRDGLVTAAIDEHGHAHLRPTPAGEQAIRPVVDQIEATHKLPVDVAPGDLIETPGYSGSVLHVQAVARSGDVVYMSGRFIDSYRAGLPVTIDWHLNGREGGWPGVSLSQDAGNADRIAHLAGAPRQYLDALAMLQGFDNRLSVRPFFDEAVRRIHEAMDERVDPQQVLPEVAGHLRGMADGADQAFWTADNIAGIRAMSSELDRIAGHIGELTTDSVEAVASPGQRPRFSDVGQVLRHWRAGGDPTGPAETGPARADEARRAADALTQPRLTVGGAFLAGAGPDGWQLRLAATGQLMAATDLTGSAEQALALGRALEGMTVAGARFDWQSPGVHARLSDPDRRDEIVAAVRRITHEHTRRHTAAGPAGDVVGPVKDDQTGDIADQAVDPADPIGATDGLRDAGRTALEDVPAPAVHPDPAGGAQGLLPRVGDAGPHPDRGAGGEPGGLGRAGGERPAEAGPVEHGPGDGRGTGDPGDDPARPGDDGSGATGGPELAGGSAPGWPARFVPHGQDDLAPAGVRHKARANIAALRTLRTLQEEDRPATDAEQRVLARWSGWGSLAEQMFGRNPEHVRDFADERTALAELLTGADRQAALDSTVNAHFTDAGIAKAIWAALGELGLIEGQVLEPGCGSGNFIGLAPAGVELVGVELDPATAGIAQALYPDALVLNEDLVDFTVPDGSFDAVVGNVPFAPRRPFDPVHNPGRQLSLHNYVISKALGQTRPGGLVALITSRYTMDAADETARRILADRAQFLGAVRLPTGAHRAAAGTEVVSDVLLLRRRPAGRASDQDRAWLHASPFTAGPQTPAASDDPDVADPDAVGVTVNDYFTAHPERVLGRASIGQGPRGRAELLVAGDLDRLQAQIAAALAGIVADAKTAGLVQAPRSEPATPIRTILAARTDLPDGCLVRNGNGFALIEGGRLVEVPVPKTRAGELADLLAIRDAAVAMLAADQASSDDTPACREARARLNALYDAYTDRFGPINRGHWARSSPRDVPLTDPQSVPVEALAVMDVIRWPGTNKRGRLRRAVVEQVTPTGQVRVAVIGAQGRDRHQPLPPETSTVTKLATRHEQRRFVREAPAVLDLDERASLVRALEAYDQDSGQARKTTLLTERIVRRPPEPGTVSSPDDALTMVIDQTGEVDLGKVAALLGTDEATARRRLGRRVFADPDTGDLISAVTYLSGDVRAKLTAAEAAAASNPDLRANVEALVEVLPAWKDADEILAYPGASWIPAGDLQTFLADILQDQRAGVSHDTGDGWRVAAGRAVSFSDPLTRSEWGTPDRDAYQIFEAMLRRSAQTVRTKEGAVDREATDAAYAAADRIRVRFEAWVWEDPARADRLLRMWNVTFNSLVPPAYPRTTLRPPGMTGLLELTGHQAAAIRRITAEPAVMVTHKVGAGKTYTVAAGLMELKRLGHIRKPMLVVPNHLKEQWQREFLTLFPDAKVLAASTEDLNQLGRARFWGRVATGDWDAVIVTQEAFRAIPVSHSTAATYIETELEAFAAEINQIAEDGGDSRTVKEERERLARRRAKLEESLAGADAGGWTFEMLGIDHLAIDEIHDYKNLARVSGSVEHSLEGSTRSMDLHVKVGWLWRTSESGRVLTGATATPLSNSFGEIHTWFRYYRPDSRIGRQSFDSFLADFALTGVKYEMTASGQREAKERTRDYRNFTGLMREWVQIADTAVLDLDVPDVDGGQPENVIVAPSPWLTDTYLPHLADRAAVVRSQGRARFKGMETMPVILSDGLAAGLDPRATGGPDIGEAGKLAWVARQVAEIYDETRNNRYDDPLTGGDHPRPGALQLVFLDLGTPGSRRRYEAVMDKIAQARYADAHRPPDDPPVEVPVRVSEQVGFEAYEELKAQLVELGVPAEQVVFMHEAAGKDAKKAAIYRRAREGEIAVLIGSTQLMGTGVNAQTRAVALHHVDCPYRASDLEQRNGRIVRIGNRNSVVRILNYATGNSHDEVKWQAVQRKAGLLNRVSAGDLTISQISELGDDLGIDEMAAQLSGSPAKVDKTRTDQELASVTAARTAFHRAQTNAKFNLEGHHRQAAEVRTRITELDPVLSRITRRDGAPVAGYPATIGASRAAVTKRTEATAAVRELIGTAIDAQRGMADGEPITLGVVGGLTVCAQVRHSDLLQGREVLLWLADLPQRHYGLEPFAARRLDNTDVLARITNYLDRLPGLHDQLQARLPQLERDIANAQRMLERTFADEDRYQALTRRAERLTQLVAWEDDPERNTADDPVPPAVFTHDPADVVAVLGELRADTPQQRQEPVSLANVTPDGRRIPRETSWMRRQEPPPPVVPAEQNPLAGRRVRARQVSPQLTQFSIEEEPDQPGQATRRVLYSVQATRDGRWAVFAPTIEEPLMVLDQQSDAERWALHRAETGPGAPAPTRQPMAEPASDPTSAEPATNEQGKDEQGKTLDTPSTPGPAPAEDAQPQRPTAEVIPKAAGDRQASADSPDFTPAEMATIRIAADDWAGLYYNSPVGGRESAIRYTVEGHLKQLRPRHSHRQLWDAVAAYLDAVPEALQHSHTRAELAAREAQRANEDQLLRGQALDAFRAGDYDQALTLIDRAEQANPDAGERLDRIRSHIQATAAQAAAAPLPDEPAAPTSAEQPAPAAPRREPVPAQVERAPTEPPSTSAGAHQDTRPATGVHPGAAGTNPQGAPVTPATGIVIEHTSSASLVFGTVKDDVRVHAVLSRGGWTWSPHIGGDIGYDGAWDLPRAWRVEVRTARVGELTQRLDTIGRRYRVEETDQWRSPDTRTSEGSPAPLAAPPAAPTLAPTMTSPAVAAKWIAEQAGDDSIAVHVRAILARRAVPDRVQAAHAALADHERGDLIAGLIDVISAAKAPKISDWNVERATDAALRYAAGDPSLPLHAVGTRVQLDIDDRDAPLSGADLVSGRMPQRTVTGTITEVLPAGIRGLVGIRLREDDGTMRFKGHCPADMKLSPADRPVAGTASLEGETNAGPARHPGQAGPLAVREPATDPLSPPAQPQPRATEPHPTTTTTSTRAAHPGLEDAEPAPPAVPTTAGAEIDDQQLQADQRQLGEALHTVRQMVPDAQDAVLATSDQGHEGFALRDVTLADGRRLSVVDPGRLTEVDEATWAHLAGLSWDATVGEDRHGNATITVPAAQPASPADTAAPAPTLTASPDQQSPSPPEGDPPQPQPSAQEPAVELPGPTVVASQTPPGASAGRRDVGRPTNHPTAPEPGTRGGPRPGPGASPGPGETGRASAADGALPAGATGAQIPPGLAGAYTTAAADLAELRAQLARARADVDRVLAGPSSARSLQPTVWEAGLQLLDAAYTSAARHAAVFAHTPAWREITRLWQAAQRVWQQARAAAARYREDPAGRLREVIHRALDPITRAICRKAEQLAAWAGEGGRGQAAAERALRNLSQAGRQVADALAARTTPAPDSPTDPLSKAIRKDQLRHGQGLDDLQAAVDARFAELDRSYPAPGLADPSRPPGRRPTPQPGPDIDPPPDPAGRDAPAGRGQSASPPTVPARRPGLASVDTAPGDPWVAAGNSIQADMAQQPGWAALSRALTRLHDADPDLDVVAMARGLADEQPLPAGRGAAVLRARLVDRHPTTRTPTPLPLPGAVTTRPRPPQRPPAPARPPAVAARR